MNRFPHGNYDDFNYSDYEFDLVTNGTDIADIDLLLPLQGQANAIRRFIRRNVYPSHINRARLCLATGLDLYRNRPHAVHLVRARARKRLIRRREARAVWDLMEEFNLPHIIGWNIMQFLN